MTNQQKEIIREVNNWKERCRANFNNNNKSYINSYTVIECMKDMKASNTQCYDGISNNMIKKYMSNRLIQVLKELYSKNIVLLTNEDSRK